jgi:hypothetical protein
MACGSLFVTERGASPEYEPEVTMPISPRTLALLFLACFACTINADFRGRGDVPANASEIAGCKSSCASQAKASCLSDAALAVCNAACEGATSNQVAHYQDCVSKNSCDTSCTSDLGQSDAGAPPQDSAPPPRDDASSDASRDAAPQDASAEAEAATDQTPDECALACEETTPDVYDCYTSPDQRSICMARCNSGSTVESRTTFIQCVKSLPFGPESTVCPQYFSSCYGPFTK